MPTTPPAGRPLSPGARRAIRLLGAFVLLSGCDGSVDSAEGPSGPLGMQERGADASVQGMEGAGQGTSTPLSECEPGSPDVGESALRRLSNTELQLTLQGLFALAEPPDLESVPSDNTRDGFTTFVDVQTLSAQHLRAYSDLAAQLAEGLLEDPERRARVVGCEPSASPCLAAFVEGFGKLAYRRPLSGEEIATHVERAEVHALDANDRFVYAVQAMLTSPFFLYRVEVGDDPEALSSLTAYELASRLSFGLWGRGPDRALMERAERGGLEGAAELYEAATEMLADERASQFYASFFRQWLGYATLRSPQAPPADWSDELLPQMQAETDAVLRDYAFGEGDLFDALTTNQTQVSPALASFYGFDPPAPSGALEIAVDHPRAQAGVLGHASLLSMKTDGDVVAVRGNWLRRTFFCASLSIPAEVAADLGDLLVGLTPVQVVEKRNSERACKGCHALIDPIGVGLAPFDHTGRFDASVDVGTYGITPSVPDAAGATFESLADLAELLANTPAVSECLSRKAFTFVSGRDAAPADRCTVQKAHAGFGAEGSFRGLLAGIVSSPSFRVRRAGSASTAGAGSASETGVGSAK